MKSEELAERLLNAWGSDMPQGPWMGIFKRHLVEALQEAYDDGYFQGHGEAGETAGREGEDG